MASISTSHPRSIVSEYHSVFSPFPRLPYELRHKIWTHYLGDSMPEMYRFHLRYPHRLRRYSNKPHRSDHVFLEPIPCVGPRSQHLLQPLRVSSTTRHIASSTCVESRQVVLETYPDTLRFRKFPIGWGDSKLRSRPDGGDYPEYVLRFNGIKDIIVFHACWEDQTAAIKVAELRGSPDDFLKIRHVGIAVGSLEADTTVWRWWGAKSDICRCKTEECQDCCKEEPLPKFLSLFPSLKTFYIAGVPNGGIHEAGDQVQAGKVPSGAANCPCPNIQLRHSWPMIRSPGVCGWFAIYDERSDCPFPKFKRIEEIRRFWRPHFPYYRALGHLEIKFIQLWDPDRCTNSRLCDSCVYSSVYPS